MSSPKLGLQLYTVRNSTLPLAEKLRLVAEAGYDGVETVRTQDVSGAELKALLDANGLEVASAHVSLISLQDDFAPTLAEHRALGTPVIIIPWLAPEARPSDGPGWRRLGRELGELASRVADKGFAFAYHNHDFELFDVGGATGLDYLLEGDESGRVGLQLDLGWVAQVGLDVPASLETWRERLVSIHAKDFLSRGVWADVGEGVVDWQVILATARQTKMPWLIVENDEPEEPFASARVSAANLRRLLRDQAEEASL